MRKWLSRLGGSKENAFFRKADLTESTEEISNPARGWYQIHTFYAQQEPDFEELRWCLHPKDRLAMVLIDIGAFRDRDLDQEALERIGRILSFFSEKHYDCIVRAVYDREGKAYLREPQFFSQIKAHLEQLGSVIGEYADSIFVFQGMLVGNWGEMHSSRFLAEEKLLQMAEILRRHKKEQTYLAVRRPAYWRMLHKEQEGKKPAGAGDMGLFDDGILGSEDHLGTFGADDRRHTSWNSAWRREDELAFETEIGEAAPNGGEAVYSQEYLEALTPEKVLESLKRMQITYLNRAHDVRTLDVWKEWKYPGTGVWRGKSVYDFAGAHLGYRFLVRDVWAEWKKGAQEFCVRAVVENTGFAACYQEAEMYLELWDEEGACISKVPGGRMKGWKSGERRTLSCMMEAGSGRLLLSAKRIKDGAVIRFGNISDEQGRVLLGNVDKML